VGTAALLSHTFAGRRRMCHSKNVYRTMLSIRLEPELDEGLNSLAKETGCSKSHHALEAIRQYLEDREDYLQGIAALERRETTITLEESPGNSCL